MTAPRTARVETPADPRLLLTESALVAAVLVGISGEDDPVPTQQQLDRVLRLARSSHERLNAEVLDRLLLAVAGSPVPKPDGEGTT